MSLPLNLICPICKKSLTRVENSLKCESNHSYDIAKGGYVNLLNPGKKNNAVAGDSKEMIRARSAFFASECYGKIRDFLINLIPEGSKVIIDAGCGEGYYTEGIADRYKDADVLGFDMSKFGAEHGAKSAKNKGITNTFYAVSNIFTMPITDESADVVVSMFAPVAYEEFARVLKKGGYLIIGAAGEKHLDGLKACLYDEVYLNEPSEHISPLFDNISVENLSYVTEVSGNEIINSLFTMTPYYHRTSLADKEKLKDVEKISTTVEVDFFILRRV